MFALDSHDFNPVSYSIFINTFYSIYLPSIPKFVGFNIIHSSLTLVSIVQLPITITSCLHLRMRRYNVSVELIFCLPLIDLHVVYNPHTSKLKSTPKGTS